NVVREDPVRKGLLYAGSERAVYVSFNDGDDWQSLRLNMPATSIRDLIVHSDDIAVATHGRSFWILDNVTTLRQIDDQVAASGAFLFKPQLTRRVRWNLNTDTPIPPEEPAGKNPPDGAMIDYYLKADARDIELEILDAAGMLVRHFSSADKPDKVNENALPYPNYWFRSPQILSGKAGMQRFIWDLHYAPPPGVRRSYPMTAILHDTPLSPVGPWVLPGEYAVRLTVNGIAYTQILNVKMDPRVNAPHEVLQEQFDLSMTCYNGLRQIDGVRAKITDVRSSIQSILKEGGDKEWKDLLNRAGRKVSAIDGSVWTEDVDVLYDAEYATRGNEETLAGLQRKLLLLMGILQGADAKATSQVIAAVYDQQVRLKEVLARWEQLKHGTGDLISINRTLQKRNLPGIRLD
ncbi:MAG: hypothetical protein NTZ35_00485, partial [Ignavibacteriales bacterium]|nr:hypothetical protein [Ignavibacteriales bacterium]